MNGIDKFLQKIPRWLSSRVSIFIYIFLFCYIVIFAIIGLAIPALHALVPSKDAQLILGNYTNVVSALGASIAASSGVVVHGKIKELNDRHKELQNTLETLHKKIDKLSENKTIK